MSANALHLYSNGLIVCGTVKKNGCHWPSMRPILGKISRLGSLHVLYQGCAIPVAWKIVKGTEKGSWKPHWLHLFQLLKDTVPKDWQVIVSADRGLYADWLR